MSRKKDIVDDLLCDLDSDVDVLQGKAELILKDGKIVKRDQYGMIRDEKGQLVKGTVGARTAKKSKKLDDILINKFGEDLEEVFDKIKQIAFYDPNKPIAVYDKEGNVKFKSRTWHYYNAQTQMQALTLMIKYYYGNPRKEVNIHETVDIKIEKKVADLTKLINDNYQKLHLVKGGKE